MSEFSGIPPIWTRSDVNALVDHALEKPCSFLIFSRTIDGTTYYYAQYGSGANQAGKIAYGGPNNAGGVSGTNASAVIQAAINALTGGGKIFTKAGNYTLSTTIPSADVSDKIILEGEGVKSRMLNAGGNFDTIDVTKINAVNLMLQDKNGVECDLTITPKMLLERMSSLPIDLYVPTAIGVTTITHLGNYIRLDSQSASYSAIQTGYAVYNREGSARTIRIRVIVRAMSLKPFFPLFAEPYKGDYSNFIEFRWVGSPPTTLRMLTRLGGIETVTNYVTTLDMLDHTYDIKYATDSVGFIYDGVLRATHTTNISSPPHEWGIIEPDGQIMAIYLKHPFLQVVTV